MLKKLVLSAVAAGSTFSAFAEPVQSMVTRRSDLKSVYEAYYTGSSRTTLTRENKYPGDGNIEVIASFDHAELQDLEQDVFGLGGRYGLLESLTLGASLPYVQSEYAGEDNSGLGDLVLSADLLAFQDLFRYPFVIPHVDAALPTGDEDDGLGTGETVISFGVSVGTVVYDALTYIIDFSYAYNGSTYFALGNPDNLFMVSGSIVWDISDRFAVLAEARMYEELDFMDDNPFEAKGGMAYRTGRDSQIAVYGGVVDSGIADTDYDVASFQLTLRF